MIKVPLVYVFVILSLCQMANAASFDCNKADIARETIICSDPTLSEADTKLNGLYTASLQRLSDHGARQLRDDQRGWLHFTGDACPWQTTSNTETRSQAVACLMSAYSNRLRDFEQIAIRRGPFLFSRIDQYSVTQLKTKVDEYDTGLATHEVSYPRIDSPVNPTTIEWNQRQIQGDAGGGCDAGDGDTSNGYSVGLVTARLISVTKTTWTYCHGTPHGFGGSSVETLVLFPSLHTLKPADLFRTDVPWQKRLNDLALESIRKESVAERYTLESLDITAVANIAADPKRWDLGEDGLALISNPYELGLGYAAHLDVMIPWAELRELMVKNPPVPQSTRLTHDSGMPKTR
jgi:uncharacterized protein